MADDRRGHPQTDHDARQQRHHRHERAGKFPVGDKEEDQDQHQSENGGEDHVPLALPEFVVEQHRFPCHPHGDVGEFRLRFLDQLANPVNYPGKRRGAFLLLHAGTKQHQDGFSVLAEAEIFVFEQVRLKLGKLPQSLGAVPLGNRCLQILRQSLQVADELLDKGDKLLPIRRFTEVRVVKLGRGLAQNAVEVEGLLVAFDQCRQLLHLPPDARQLFLIRQ